MATGEDTMASDATDTATIDAVPAIAAQPAPWSWVNGFAEGLSRAIDTLLGVGMIASVLLNFANVVGRYVLGIAVIGADELMIYGMIATIFLGAISVTWKDAHLRLDVMVDAMPAFIRKSAKRSVHLVIAVLCATVGAASATMAIDMAHFDQRSISANLPMVLPHGAVAVGMSLMALMAILRFLGFGPVPYSVEKEPQP
jgi:TRAP-type C4-dicarboxylate transport system permease small subunit